MKQVMKDERLKDTVETWLKRTCVYKALEAEISSFEPLK